jgi:isopropylmalate/homocitrate/citramalate synthase
LGIGERTGNCPMESMLVEYHQLKTPKNKINFEQLNDVVLFFEKEFGYKIHSKMPFLGTEFNATSAGIHADGIMKNESIYNSFDSKKIFDKNIRIVVNQYSGVAGISGWINLFYNLEVNERVSKKDKRINLVKNLVDAEYEKGRNTAISDNEMKKIVESVFGDVFEKTAGHFLGQKEDLL